MREFIEYLKVVKNYSDNTINNYEIDIDEYKVFLDHKGITNYDVDYKTVREYVEYLSKLKYKNTTISRRISALRSFYKFLYKKGKVKANPMPLISNPKKEKVLPKFLYINEIEELLGEPDDIYRIFKISLISCTIRGDAAFCVSSKTFLFIS